MKRVVWCFLAIFLWGGAAPAQDIEVQTILERPLFFAGQPFRYQVRILHLPSVEFVMERFDQENFQLEPFQVEGLRVDQSREGDFGRLSIEMDLVTFEIQPGSEAGNWEIPSFPLYYSRAGASTVEVLTIPPTPVAFGRTVPEESVRIRDEFSYEERSGAFWLALLLGCSGILLAGVPVGLTVYRRMSGETVEVSLERSEIRQRAHLALVESKNVEGQDVQAFYRSLGNILREYGGRLGEKRGLALTVAELELVLLEAGEEKGEVERVIRLVALADEVGHSRSGTEKGREGLEEAHREALALLQ